VAVDALVTTRGDAAGAPAGDGLLWLLQIVDAAFPNGGFADSRGLEALCRHGDRREQVEQTIVAATRLVVARGDVHFALAARAATSDRDASELRRASVTELASRVTRLQRVSSLRRGRSTLRVAGEALEDPARETVRWAASTLGDEAPYAAALGAVAAAGDVADEELARGLVHAEARGMAEVLVRLGLAGPAGAQRIVRRATRDALADARPPDEWSTFAPILDVSSMQHEVLAERLFES
jgi:urease accessory protein